MDNKIVARYLDGRMVKGTTTNFSPGKDRFFVATDRGGTVEVFLSQLKAVFFVRELAGNPGYREKKSFEGAKGFGRKLQCEFRDGETLCGFAQSYDPARPGFFLFPTDASGNNERVFVVNASLRRVTFA